MATPSVTALAVKAPASWAIAHSEPNSVAPRTTAKMSRSRGSESCSGSCLVVPRGSKKRICQSSAPATANSIAIVDWKNWTGTSNAASVWTHRLAGWISSCTAGMPQGRSPLRADDRLLEEHLAYMDRFATTMIARGPTLAPDRETPTGSMHVLGLPSMEAATEFVEREPNNRAGVYAQHRIWAFENLLGRTMWEFTSGADEPRFLVIALASDEEMPHASAQPVPLANCGADLRERLMVYGALTKPEGRGRHRSRSCVAGSRQRSGPTAPAKRGSGARRTPRCRGA